MSDFKDTNEKLDVHVIDAVFDTIAARHADFKAGENKDSRTVSLFKKGVPKIAQKVGEEATEVVIEAIQKDKKLLVEESVDLLYFLLVLWKASGVNADKVWAEMAKRHGLPEHAERLMREQSKKSSKG